MCGCKKSVYTENEVNHILNRVSQGLSPDVIYGREGFKLPHTA